MIDTIKKMKQKNFKLLPVLVSVFLFSVLLCAAIYAWSEPIVVPTGGNINAPINTGALTQTKNGNFNIMGMMGIGTASPSQKFEVAGNVKGSGLCIGNACCTNWTECVSLGGGNSCRAIGANCNSNANCCSSVCTNNLCADNSQTGCRAIGTVCGANTDCCSSICASGTCANGDCKTTGTACGTNSECCTSLCSAGTCAIPSVCQANGTACSADSACCSSSCAGGICSGGASCKDSLIACSSNEVCCSGVCSSGYCTNYYPCGKPSPAGIKQIFTTSGLYNGYAFTANREDLADAKCQDTAYNAKLTPKSSTHGKTGATFKAMVYLGARQINTILASGNEFRNPKKNGSVCDLVPVASNASDFFSAEGGSYLMNAISNDETGRPITSGTTVWTNYKANSNPLDDTYASWTCTGNSNYRNVGNFRNVCHENGYYLQRYYYNDRSYENCEEGQHWYGNPNQKNATWAYQNKVYFIGYGMYNNGTNYPHDACINLNRALYCVEQ